MLTIIVPFNYLEETEFLSILHGPSNIKTEIGIKTPVFPFLLMNF